METTLYIRFFFVCHLKTFFNTSQLRYLSIQYSHAFLMTLELRCVLVRIALLFGTLSHVLLFCYC